MYTIENAIKLMDNTCTTDPQREAWQTLKSVVLSQQTNNSASTKRWIYMRRTDISKRLFNIQKKMALIIELCEELKKASYDIGMVRAALDIMEGEPQLPQTPQGQNGTAGKPQVGECTTSAIA